MKLRAAAITLIVLTALVLSCERDEPVYDSSEKKLVIVLIDGPRWEETWGDPTHQYQPYLRDSLQPYGSIFTNFYNNGPTLTNPGHAALLTGHYQNMANNGTELPSYPSLAQLMLAKRKKAASFSWLVTSKDKLEVFKTCTHADWKDQYTPSSDCGNSGNGTGYRADSVTYARAIQVLQEQHPDFIFIQFKEPDVSGHANNWQGYLDGIRSGDKYAWQIWKFLQSSAFYKNNTTFVITNDHGRHNDGVADGFRSHGDNCVGCRHINLFMAGPGIRRANMIATTYEQIDLHKTLCSLYGLNDQFSEGKVIREINPF
jgi:arylsulfatase A-like enzyme